MTKVELLPFIKLNRKEKVCAVDNLLREHGHEVSRLPPYHCHFSAIDLIWAKAKTYYNQHIDRDGDGDYKIVDMWTEALDSCDSNVWSNCVRHTDEEIKRWYDR